MEILLEAKQGECVPGCNGQWLSSALEVFESNGIQKEMLTSSIKELLKKGRGKFRNVMICGPANCADIYTISTHIHLPDFL